jgi:DNA-binding XRE family transcriptional regulator
MNDKELYTKVLGQVVEFHRDRQVMTQTSLAQHVGITQTTISRIERGEVQASVVVIRSIANALKLGSVSELLKEVEEVYDSSHLRHKEFEATKMPDWMKQAAGVATLGALGFVLGSALAELADRYQNKK